jgi:hypothetical protein
MAHGVLMGSFGHEEAQGLEVLDHELAGVLHLEAAVLLGHVVVEGAVGGEDVYAFEIVALAYLEVVGVVGRRDLDEARAEGAVDVGIRDEGYVRSVSGRRSILPSRAL